MENNTLKLWKTKETRALHGSDLKKIERQVNAGKKTARERLSLLLDPESFEEIECFLQKEKSLIFHRGWVVVGGAKYLVLG